MTTDSSGMEKGLLVWVALILLVLIFTFFLFWSFRPDRSDEYFWITLVDVLIMEIAVGLSMVFAFQSREENTESGSVSTAMRISIAYLTGLLLVVGVFFDLAALFLLRDMLTPTVFLWVILGKWLLWIIVCAVLWVAGKK